MEYIKRILRVLAIALLSPLMVATFCIGLASMPLTYGVICAYFYIKDGKNFNYREDDHCTDAVFYFFMEDMWHLPTKYILKLK